MTEIETLDDLLKKLADFQIVDDAVKAECLLLVFHHYLQKLEMNQKLKMFTSLIDIAKEIESEFTAALKNAKQSYSKGDTAALDELSFLVAHVKQENKS